jgi:hypothetical protein
MSLSAVMSSFIGQSVPRHATLLTIRYDARSGLGVQIFRADVDTQEKSVMDSRQGAVIQVAGLREDNIAHRDRSVMQEFVFGRNR